MSGPVRRDSLGRSDLYQNPYDIRHFAKPEMKKFRAETFANSQDVIQLQLEKDILVKLKEGYIRLSNGRFLLIIYAGKALLMVTALPAYMFFYGIPKWIITEGYPRIAKPFKKAREQLLKAYKEWVHDAFKAMASKVKIFCADKVDRTKAYLNHLLESLKTPIKAFYKKHTDPLFQKIEEKRVAIEKALTQVTQFVKEKFQKTRQFFLYLPNDLVQIAQKWVNQVKNLSFSPFEKVLEKGKEFLNSFKKIEIPFKISFKPPLALLEPLKIPVEYAKKKVQQAVEVIHKVTETIEKRAERIREWGNEIVKNVSNFASESVAALIQSIPIPQISLFIPMPIVRTVERFKRSAKTAIKHIKSLQDKFQKASNELFQKARKYAAKIANKVHDYLVTIPAKAWKVITRVLAFVAELFHRITYLLRIITTGVRVLIRQGILTLREQF